MPPSQLYTSLVSSQFTEHKDPQIPTIAVDRFDFSTPSPDDTTLQQIKSFTSRKEQLAANIARLKEDPSLLLEMQKLQMQNKEKEAAKVEVKKPKEKPQPKAGGRKRKNL